MLQGLEFEVLWDGVFDWLGDAYMDPTVKADVAEDQSS